MKRLLFVLIPCVLLLTGCISRLDQYYVEQLEPIYRQWLYKPWSDESDRWLEQNTKKIEADMRKD